MTQARKIKQIVDMTGCDLFEAKEIVLKYHPTEKQTRYCLMVKKAEAYK